MTLAIPTCSTLFMSLTSCVAVVLFAGGNDSNSAAQPWKSFMSSVTVLSVPVGKLTALQAWVCE